jgi:hypothetical protein
MDAALQMARGSLVNYASVRENRVDEVKKEFSQGTISRLAIIVKERPDETKKRRLIIDLRRS